MLFLLMTVVTISIVKSWAVRYTYLFSHVPTVQRLCPNESHMADAHHVLRYLQGTASLGITFGGPVLQLHGFSDANFTTPTSNGKSVSGYRFYYRSHTISLSLSPFLLLSNVGFSTHL